MSTKRKIWISIIVIILALPIGLVYWAMWTGSTKDIESVADQFKPDSSWQLVNSNVEPPAHVCYDVTCPSLSRMWSTGKPLTTEQFRAALDRAGWDFKIDKECTLPDNRETGGSIGMCSAEGVIGKYAVSIGVSIRSSSTEGLIDMYLELNDK